MYKQSCSKTTAYFVTDSLKNQFKGITGVYPIPTEGAININYFASFARKDAKISLYSIDGKIVKEIKVEDRLGLNKHNVTLDDVSSGTYIVKIENTCRDNVVRIVIIR